MSRVRGVLCGAFLLLVFIAAPAAAQQASIVGTAADQTKAVLPGVTLTAIELSTGAQVVAVSDERGEFRLLQLQPGVYKLQAELEGFATVLVPRVELQVGQNATVPIAMSVSTVNESVTVTGEAALVDTTSSQVAGNVSRAQMQELPLLGRNWIELSKMIAGVTANVVTLSPGTVANMWQMNLDGQQVTQKSSQGLGQPKFSRDAIAEFQIVTNMFDITQGRSEGMQVQAISKSGTNQTQGSVYGFFRDDAFNAADPISHTVLPYQDQQWGGTIGGPIIANKAHYFFSYEPERNPGTTFSTVQALAGETFSTPYNIEQNSYLARVDDQLSANNRLSIRGTYWSLYNPASLASNAHPSQALAITNNSPNVQGTWSRVISPTMVQEVRVGYNGFVFELQPPAALGSTPQYNFPGLTIGKSQSYPQWHNQTYTNARYDLSWHRGGHDVKIGAEYLNARMWDKWYQGAAGIMTFTSLPSDMASRIPQATPLDLSTWNLTGINSLAQKFNINYALNDNFEFVTPGPTVALWTGDNWRINNRMTVNYGVRWDDSLDVASVPGTKFNSIPITQYTTAVPTTSIPGLSPGDFGYKNGTKDNLSIAPRVGFAWNVGGSGDFVIRGGSGLYFTFLETQYTKAQLQLSNFYSAEFVNKGQADFVSNPTGGISTYAQALSTNSVQTAKPVSPDYRNPYTWQSSIGFSKQVGERTGVTADLVHYNLYHDTLTIDPNLFYDPTTGYNVNPSVGRPNPAWGQLNYFVSTGRQDYTALQTSVTRRLTRGIQGGANYTLMFDWHDTGLVGSPGANNPFDYVNGEYATSTQFQRGTLRGWMIYEIPWGLQAGLSYSYGSGNRYAATIATAPYGKPGQNRLNLTAAGGPTSSIVIPAAVLDRWEGQSIIASGDVIPRDALDGTTFSRTDLRLTKSVKLGNKLRAQLIAEVFNVLNHTNYTSFNTSLSATSASTTASFGQPTTADVGRQGQFAFRFTF